MDGQWYLHLLHRKYYRYNEINQDWEWEGETEKHIEKFGEAIPSVVL
jgi:hypothetical protein